MDDLSPEAVAGRLRYCPKLPRVSARTIRRFIASIYGRRVETHRWLRKQRRRRRGRRTSLPPRTFIDRRPSYINRRSKVGDAEADFIVSGTSGKGLLLVVVDRRTRMVLLERIVPVSIPCMEAAFLRIKERFPELRTLTTDNDILFRHHERLAALLHVRIFFCHPYHAWEKGSVEHANKVIRRDIPKGTNISRVAPHALRALEAKLNRRPMACLNYRTPAEMLLRYRTRVHNNKKRAGAR